MSAVKVLVHAAVALRPLSIKLGTIWASPTARWAIVTTPISVAISLFQRPNTTSDPTANQQPNHLSEDESFYEVVVEDWMVVAAAATIIGWLLPAVLFMKARQSMAQSLDLSPHPAAVSPNARVGTPDTSSKAPHSSGVPATPRTPAGVRVAKHRKNLFGHEKPFDDEAAAAARRAAAALHQVASTKSPAISLARASKHAPGAKSLLTASPTATVSAASSDDSRYSSDALSVPASSRPAPTAGLILPQPTTAQQTRPPAVPFAAPCPRLLDSRTSASKAAAASALTAHSSAKPHGLARNAKPNRPTTALNEAACGDATQAQLNRGNDHARRIHERALRHRGRLGGIVLSEEAKRYIAPAPWEAPLRAASRTQRPAWH